MATTKWIVDPTHSELGFKIKHLMISHVSGTFRTFTAEAETIDEDFTTAKITLVADLASISTNNEQRDAHLRTSDFFEAEKFPQLTFRSTRIARLDDERFEMHGDLTLKGITRPVTLNVEYSGVTRDPWGGERAGFVVTGKIKRTDWGVNFNAVLETGGIALSEDVRIASEIQLVKQVELVDA